MGGSFSVDRFTFYAEAADYAKKKKVTVNILSIKGDKCNVKELGKLSLATGGSILKIDLDKMGTEFNKIISEEIVGADAKITVRTCRMFTICDNKVEGNKLS